MLTRRLFYICAAILCLAATYHLGATNATAAKPGPSYQCFGFGPHGSYAVKDRTLYRADPTGTVQRFPVPVPGTAKPIACGESAGIEAVILANGHVWLWDGNNVQWKSGGSLPQ